MKEKSNGLVTQFFHTFEDGRVRYQGVVVSNPEPGYYLVQLFGWGMGEDTCRRLYHISEMSEWLFYRDAGQMREYYQSGMAQNSGPKITKPVSPEDGKKLFAAMREAAK